MNQAAKNNSSLLLEIGAEEMPARFIPGSLTSLKEHLLMLLNDMCIEFRNVFEYATPRRLAILIEEVSEDQKDRKLEILGPSRKIAFDEKGHFTNAAIGFARSQNVDVKELTVVKTERGEYVAAVREETHRKTMDILSEKLPGLITSLQFAKSMRWGSSTIRFVRPIKWITAIFGEDKINFEIDGIKSSSMTRGHRFMSPGAFKIHDPSTYSHILLNNFVVAAPDMRKNMIVEGIKQIESGLKYNIHKDDALLTEVTFLVEYPTVVLGNFNPEYLSLPKELLITVMKNHQKYFSVEDRKGNLLPHFILVSNTKAENNDTVKRGAERVLKARLEDAKFYFNEDRKKPLYDHIEKLKKVTFQEKLGSVFEKVERIAFICSFLAEEFNIQDKEKVLRAAMLSKADLVTGVVREFPELQGYIGMMYAVNSGEDQEVASAIYEHYKPRFSGDDAPSGVIGTIVSLADKMDNIASFFLVGLIPSGSEDPYGLRRQALGVIKILQELDVNLPLNVLMEKAVKGVEDCIQPRKTLGNEILSFFYQRFEVVLLNEGYSYDLVNAVLPGDEVLECPMDTLLSGNERHDIKDILKRIKTLSQMKGKTGFPELLTAAKRTCNILAKIKPSTPKEELMSETAEKELFKTAEKIKNEVKEKNYTSLFELTKPINDFFETVLVMDKKPEIKQNRLALLSYVKMLFDSLGDFSKIAE